MEQADEVIADIATRVARRYARRCWWADEEDLRQEALTIAIECRGPDRWSPEVGVPFAAYAWHACILHLTKYLWRNSAPVSESEHHLKDLRGVHRAPLVLIDEYAAVDPDLGELLDDHEWHVRVRDQLSFLFTLQGKLDARVAARILLDEEKPAAVAAEMGIDASKAYRIARRARDLIATNALLYELHQERNEP